MSISAKVRKIVGALNGQIIPLSEESLNAIDENQIYYFWRNQNNIYGFLQACLDGMV